MNVNNTTGLKPSFDMQYSNTGNKRKRDDVSENTNEVAQNVLSKEDHQLQELKQFEIASINKVASAYLEFIEKNDIESILNDLPRVANRIEILSKMLAMLVLENKTEKAEIFLNELFSEEIFSEEVEFSIKLMFENFKFLKSTIDSLEMTTPIAAAVLTPLPSAKKLKVTSEISTATSSGSFLVLPPELFEYLFSFLK